MGVGGQQHAPAALAPVKTRYPLYRRLGGPQGRSGRMWKISPPPAFDPRTVQPVVSCNTDWAVANMKVQNIFHGRKTLHVAQIVNTEQLQQYIP